MHFLVIVGTRPEAIKLAPLVRALEVKPNARVTVLTSGQHREILDQARLAVGLKSNINLRLMTHQQSLEQLSSNLLMKISQVLDEMNPDIVVVQGDTTTTAMSALAAHYRQIPVAHVEAGLRSGDLDNPWPEEANRRMVAQLARLHFAPTEHARGNLLKENITPEHIFVTGNTGVDAAFSTLANTEESGEVAAIGQLLRQLRPKRIVLATVHRRESLFGGVHHIADALDRLTNDPSIALILPLHPNPKVARAFDRFTTKPGVHVLSALGHPAFLRLLQNSDVVLTDSGGVEEEAVTLGIPVLALRTATDRPEGLAVGVSELVGYDADLIVEKTNAMLSNRPASLGLVSPFGDGHAAERIVEHLLRFARGQP